MAATSARQYGQWPDRTGTTRSRTARVYAAALALPVVIGCLTSELAAPMISAMAPHRDSASARAMPAHQPPESTDLLNRALILSAYSGVSYTHDSTVAIQRADGKIVELDDVSWGGDPFRNPIYYGARAGGWLGWLPVGGVVDFTHAKAIAQLDNVATIRRIASGGLSLPSETRERIGDVFSKLEFSHGHNLLLATALYRLPFAGARISPYVGFGLGTSVPHVEVQEAGLAGRTYDYQVVGPAGQVLFGLELRLARTSVFIEYKFSAAYYAPKLTDEKGGYLVTDLLTHHLIGGFTVRTDKAVPAQ